MQTDRGVMLQFFHWYSPNNGTLWNQLAKEAKALSKAGFTALWLPPAYKGAAGKDDTGYGVYDLYDLGEFDQKGSIRTKYGTKQQYLDAIAKAHAVNLHLYGDVVLNHRMGADEKEVVKARPYLREDRTTPIGDYREIEAYTRFLFTARNGVYSDFSWNWQHFDAVDHDARNAGEQKNIYVFEGKAFDNSVSSEFGNYDYLMGCDLDFECSAVRDELLAWGRWYRDISGVDGFRIDAVKHIPAWFFPQWITALTESDNKQLFFVAEYWTHDVEALCSYCADTQGLLSLFDVPLHFKFYQASRQRREFDLSTIFTETLVSRDPTHAVTFVANHDSQALQALESVVESWFKPLAYALILLRREGYPCVFVADYSGANYRDTGGDGKTYTIEMPSYKTIIETMIRYRKSHTFGEQYNYFDHPNAIGWSFLGDDEHPHAMAVLLSNGDAAVKRMTTGKAQTSFIDVLQHCTDVVLTYDQGIGEFHCLGESVSVWVPRS